MNRIHFYPRINFTIEKRCVGGLSWPPGFEMHSFQGKDISGEEDREGKGPVGIWMKRTCL